MQRSSTARLLPMFITVVIIIVVIVAVISIGRAIFGGDSAGPEEVVDRGRTELLDTSPENSVRLTVRGPIVAEEEFKSYSIEISSSDRTMNIYGGYLEDIERSKELLNNTEAYEQFVYALDKADMMKGDVPTDDAENDLRGICATGYVYEYSVLTSGATVKRLWTSTCDGSRGSLDASVEQLNSLFLDQIPDSRELVPFGSRNPLRLRF